MRTLNLSLLQRLIQNPGQRLHLILCSLLLLLALTTGLIASTQIYQSNSAQAQSFGQTLARLTAEAATGLLVTDDRVSMNVLLGRLLENPYVVSATIYGVDGEILAQAQPRQGVPAFSQAFSAPIHYQEVIAAYVRLELNGFYLDRPVGRALLLILLSTLAIMAAGIWLLRRNTQALLEAPSMPVPTPEAEPTIAPPPAAAPGSEPHPLSSREDNAVIVAVVGQNLGKLSRCLQPREVQQLLDIQLHALEAGARLYGGRLNYSSEGNSFIAFAESAHADYRFRAICCTLLLRTLLAEVPVHAPARLHFGFGLALSETDQPLWPASTHPALHCCASSEALGLASHAGQDGISLSEHLQQQLAPELSEQLETEPNDGGAELLGLHGHYATLLEHQLDHLLTQLRGDATSHHEQPA